MKPGPFFLLLLAPLLFSACAPLPILPPVAPPGEEVFQQVKARQGAVLGLKGLAQVKVSSPEKSFSNQEVLFARRPGFLRVESLSPLGTPLFYLVTDGKEIRLYDPGENRYYRGGWRNDALSFALPLTLPSEEVVLFLLGGVPLMDPESISLRPETQEGLWILDLRSSARGERQTLWVHPRFFYIVRADLQRPGSSYQLFYSDFRPVKEILFPHEMRLFAADRKIRISVEFSEVDLNPEWKDQDFSLPVPRGATVLPWP
jgi:outer membrane lipoprotein-sorting protein